MKLNPLAEDKAKKSIWNNNSITNYYAPLSRKRIPIGSLTAKSRAATSL
ncbi:hypothetical protein [Falsiporphyromonas endometrii]|uniref:Uncharacterized protein n=1 Tax=Falsiporphyromonas endometrii TaxID=1387297 RepID=A0ABV9K6L5_9PORP